MADILTRHLIKKGEEHSALEMLVNQWGFDRQLIPKALQTIGGLFPHYSRHDESHSKQILINIERLLGDNIKLLTATDTWLLLEAAYWHDIGMVVPQADMKKVVDDEDFLQYVESIRNSPFHELNEFCSKFDFNDVSRCFGGAKSPVDAVDKFRQLMAEWFRRRHARRADNIIQSPWTSVGISSPRTELIPSRLFKVLGRICEMHGASFEELLGDNGLPFREAGLAQEDCHPRFVACLLRMGDLLDLDDNRFCPVMQRIAGDDRPHLSKAHEDKHSSIRHLRIDREYIEIDAECDSIDGYVEAFKWFDWLRKEMQDQMANWQRIVPSRELGLLPTLGDVTVRLKGELQILSEGARPQFTIDSERAKKLLQGSNLYSDKYACVRELLQNAVDATLLRLWLEKGGERGDANWDTPFLECAKTALESAYIDIRLEEKENAVDDGKSNWLLTITDQGTGISRDDLIHMLKIGGSQGNFARQKKISSMPEWMKPSGVFGIGFQSVFLICDEVSVTTKSIFSGETLNIIMHSPTKNKEGLVLLKRLSGNISRTYGTKIEINLSVYTDERPHISREKGNSIAYRMASSFDPVLDESVPLAAANLADKIYEFGENSPIGLRGEMITLDGKHRITFQKDSIRKSLLGQWHFLKNGEHQLRIRYRPVKSHSIGRELGEFYYRGQGFKAYVHTPACQIEADLMSGKAGSWLNASRDGLAANAGPVFSKLVLSSLARIVKEDLARPNFDGLVAGGRAIFSFFLQSMAHFYKGEWIELAEKLGDSWSDMLSPDGVNTFRDYLNKDEVIIVVGSSEAFSEKNKKLVISLQHAMARLFLAEWVKLPNKSISVVSGHDVGLEEDPFDVYYSLKSVPQVPYSKPGLAWHLLSASRLSFTNSRFILRIQGDEWSSLYLRENVDVQASEIFDYVPRVGGRVLLPFLYRANNNTYNGSIEVTSLDELCAWIKPRLINDLSISEIRERYDRLINYIDNEIMRKSRYRKEWAVCRGITVGASKANRAAA